MCSFQGGVGLGNVRESCELLINAEIKSHPSKERKFLAPPPELPNFLGAKSDRFSLPGILPDPDAATHSTFVLSSSSFFLYIRPLSYQQSSSPVRPPKPKDFPSFRLHCP